MNEEEDDIPDETVMYALQLGASIAKQLDLQKIPHDIAGMALSCVLASVGMATDCSPQDFDLLLNATKSTFLDLYEQKQSRHV